MAKYKKDIDLFECIFKDKTKKAINLQKEIRKSVIIFAVVAVIVGGVLGAAAGTQKIMVEGTKLKIANLREKNDFDKINANKLECERLTNSNQKIQEELAKFSTAPQFRTELFEYIAAAQPDEITINSMSYSDSQIAMSCTGTKELTGAQFANRLREEDDIFSDVEYSGVQGTEGDWSFSIKVEVRNKAAEEAEANVSEETTEEASGNE